METEEDYVAFVLCILCIVILRWRLSTRYRHVWSRDWLLRRQQHSAYHTLLQELDREDPGEHANYLRIYKETLDMLLTKIKPYIQRENTRMRDAISPEERLALFLNSFDLIFLIISFSSIRPMSLDVTVSVQIKSAMISSCSNISPPNIGHVLLFTMLLPESLLLLIGYLMASLISYH